jgi:hypothetical protein
MKKPIEGPLSIGAIARALYEEAYREVGDHRLAAAMADQMILEALKDRGTK